MICMGRKEGIAAPAYFSATNPLSLLSLLDHFYDLEHLAKLLFQGKHTFFNGRVHPITEHFFRDHNGHGRTIRLSMISVLVQGESVCG